MEKNQKHRRKGLITSILISALLFLGVFEISYRNLWFDFYKAEYTGLNTPEVLKSENPKILICGDSFTAMENSYIDILRDSLPAYSIVNGAVPGTGIRQHSIYIPKRIKQCEPDVFVYQFYVGNDLFDIKHPTKGNVSVLRKVYWKVTDRLLSLAWLNFRLAGFRYRFFDDAGGSYRPKEKDEFAKEAYSKREKFNFKAEPYLIENTLYLVNGREDQYQYFKRKLQGIIEGLAANTRKVFLIIPHISQTSKENYSNMMECGAQFEHKLYKETHFPIYDSIASFCTENSLVMVDPLNQIKSEYKKGNACYYANDPHLNQYGQQLIAQVLLESLKQIVRNP